MPQSLIKSKKSFIILATGRKVAAGTGLSGSAQRSRQARPGRRLLHPGQHQPERHRRDRRQGRR